MSSQSPSSVLYSSDGYELAVVNNGAIPSGTRALLVSGTGPDGYSRFVPTSINGVFGTAEMSNNFIVHSAAVITTSGSQLVTGNFFGTQQINIVVNVGTVTGVGSIVYTIQEVDAGDGITVYGSSASTVSISSGNAPGVFTASLNSTTSSSVKISWVVTGSFSATIYATITTRNSPLTQAISGTVAVTQSTNPWVVSGTVTSNQGTPNTLANAWPTTITDGYGNIQGSAVNPIYVTGTITASNPSVGTDGAAALGFDTQVGGKVTTSAPAYTNGNLNALSLTTLGGLRIDGIYATGTATGTAADAIVSGGYVTTAAPTYTTGQLNALSLTTAGALRVDGSGVTQPVSGTITANQGTSPWIVAGGGTAGTAASGVVTIQGISGMTPVSVTTNKAASSSVTSVASSATNVTLLAANANRQIATIYNDSSKTVFVKLGATASNTSFTILLMPNAYWEVPSDYTGQIDAIWSAANGNARITECT